MIYGERLRLRAAEREDIPRFVAWLNDPEVRQFLLINQPISQAWEERWFENMVNHSPAEQVLVIQIQDGSDWKAIGNTSFMDINATNRSAEIGIFIGEKSCWNQGYGRETMRLMLKHGFETLNLHRIYLRVFEHNMRGIKAYEHAGFMHEGRMRQAQFQNGRYYDVLFMSVLSDEYFGTAE
jgi:UDP-4-amino-4,6-dideoxy-N-acetyl-beta-L-altrosamine N-acetyltransferase